MKKLRIGIISILCVVALTICECIPLNAFADEKKEYDVYCVSIRANLRAKATKNSRWIMTIPTGVFVVIEGELQNSYYKAQYGEYEGYIYKGCIKKTDDCTYYNYQLQFPDLFDAVLPENASDVMVDKFNTYNNSNTKEVNGKVKYTGKVHSGSNVADEDVEDNKQKNDVSTDPLSKDAKDKVEPKANTDDIAKKENDTIKRRHTCTAGLGRKKDAALATDVSNNEISDNPEENKQNDNSQSSNEATSDISSNETIPKNEKTDDGNDNGNNDENNEGNNDENNEGKDNEEKQSTGINTIGVDPTLVLSLPGGGQNKKKTGKKAQQDTIESKVLAQSNLRDAPSIEGAQILIIPMGDIVEVLDSGDNGYAHVLYKEQEGYIFTRCIDYKEDKENGNGLIDTVIVDELEKKSGKRVGVSYSPSAYSIQRHAVANNASVMLSDKVYSKELAKEEAEVNVDTSVVSAKTSTESLMNVEQNVIGRTANLRSVASPDSNIITTIAVGTNITVLGSNAGGYTMVQYEGKIGYVAEECIADSIDITQFGTEPLLFSVTAYCSCKKCCGNYSPEVRGGEAHTATGTVPEQGRTIAVDPSVIPYGTKVYIDGYGTFIAEDCGGAIKGNHIDMYFGTHADAIAFGSKRLYCTVVNE